MTVWITPRPDFSTPSEGPDLQPASLPVVGVSDDLHSLSSNLRWPTLADLMDTTDGYYCTYSNGSGSCLEQTSKGSKISTYG